MRLEHQSKSDESAAEMSDHYEDDGFGTSNKPSDRAADEQDLALPKSH